MAVANTARTQPGQRAVDFLLCDRATLDINQSMGIAPKESNHTILSVHRNAVSIRVGDGRRDYRPYRNLFNLSDSLQNIPNLPPFDRKLVFVSDVLIGAAAASTEVRALRLNAERRTFSKIDNFRLSEFFFVADDLGRDAFTVNCEWNKDRLAVFTRNAFATKSDVLDF